jgi:hypothetical protein
LQERQAELLPVPYFHLVFTIDHRLNGLLRWYAAIIYDLLFASAADTLKAFARNYLGGQPGFVAVLHTWGQDLGLHVHLHCIVAGGALSTDGSRWRSCRLDFLFPIVELSAHFRDRFCEGLQRLYRKGMLRSPGCASPVADQLAWEAMVAEMRAKNWEVYAKEPFGGAQKVLDYLGRYVHRVAISNHRLVCVGQAGVRFRYRDHRNDGQLKQMHLGGEEFLQRFLQHVLPDRFVRIRYHGFLQGRFRDARLKRIRELLGVVALTTKPHKESVAVLLQRLTGVDLSICPVCGRGRMTRRSELPPAIYRKTMPTRDFRSLAKAA